MLAPPRLREALTFYRTWRGKLVACMKGRPALQCSDGPTWMDGNRSPPASTSNGNLIPEPSFREGPRLPETSLKAYSKRC